MCRDGGTERVSRYGRVRSHVLFRHQILAHRQVDSANAYCVGPKTRRNGDAFVLCSGPIVVDLYVDGFCMSTCNGDTKPESTASGLSLPPVDNLYRQWTSCLKLMPQSGVHGRDMRGFSGL